MSNYREQAKEILEEFLKAGSAGLTLKALSKRVESKGCGHDCESWIETFLEAGVIEKIGRINSANLYALTEKGRNALVES